MRKHLLLLTAAISLAVSVPMSAGQWDKLTKLDVKETILIPGQELPPGKYVLKLMDSQSDRHIVMIYNEDQSKHIATVLAIPNTRLQPTGDTVLQYWETPAGVPPALRAWFYPGDNFGQEFAYPKKMAAELSRVNNAKVMYYDGPDRAANTPDTFKSTEVYDAPQQTAAVTPQPAPIPESGDTAAVAVKPEPAPAPAPAPEPQPTVAQQPPPVVAQNRAPEPAPVAPAPEPLPADQQLPVTATNIPALALAGLTLVGLAGAMRMRKVRS